MFLRGIHHRGRHFVLGNASWKNLSAAGVAAWSRLSRWAIPGEFGVPAGENRREIGGWIQGSASRLAGSPDLGDSERLLWEDMHASMHHHRSCNLLPANSSKLRPNKPRRSKGNEQLNSVTMQAYRQTCCQCQYWVGVRSVSVVGDMFQGLWRRSHLWIEKESVDHQRCFNFHWAA
jgi:hypothetical protein